MASRVSNRMSISAWPAVPTSWCCTSVSIPTFSSVRIISDRRSWKWSMGGTGKYPSLYRGLNPRFGFSSVFEFQIPSTESTEYDAECWSWWKRTSLKM